MSLLCLYDFGSSNVNDFKLIKGYKRSKPIIFDEILGLASSTGYL